MAVAIMKRPVAMKIGPPKCVQGRKLPDQPFAARIGEEEDHQRSELQRQLEQRIDLFLLRVAGVAFEDRIGFIVDYATPAIALAKSLAEKGSRSSTCSPTPMK